MADIPASRFSSSHRCSAVASQSRLIPAAVAPPKLAGTMVATAVSSVPARAWSTNPPASAAAAT
ncbi:hypothetical protein AB0L13_38870 [Saccharopolyspora shandongensis]|uniref:hypothetical protein n=1 Tax=Saccharopolyspora shandongensis TaxID=418495 RepID=UPI003430EAC3